MLMSNNEYEYCAGDFYPESSPSGDIGNGEPDNTKDILTTLETTVQLQPLSLNDAVAPSSNPPSCSTSLSSSTKNNGSTSSSPSMSTSHNYSSNSSPSSISNSPTSPVVIVSSSNNNQHGNNGSNNNSTMCDTTLNNNGFPIISVLDNRSYTDYIDELAQDLESRYWENKPPEQWTSEDVWHWIFSWAGDRSVDVEEVQPLAYSNMNGSQLIQMSKNDFVNLNPKYGGHIFETLQSLSSQFRDFRSNSLSSGSSTTSSMTGGSPPHQLVNSIHPNGVNGNHNGNNHNNGSSHLMSITSNNNGNHEDFVNFNSHQFHQSLPSFDLLRASCLDLDCQGSSPGSSVGESDRDSTSSILNSSSPSLSSSASPPSTHLIHYLPHSNNGNHHHHGSHHLLHSSSNGSVASSASSTSSSISPPSPLVHHDMGYHGHHHAPLPPHHTFQQPNGMSPHTMHLPSLSSKGGMSSFHHSSNSCMSNGSSMNPLINPLSSGMMTSGSGSNGSLGSGGPLIGQNGLPTKKVGRRGRPPKKDGSKSRSRAGKGNGKLWEFIRDLLLDPMTNPSFIRWERREDGIFKFVQSDKVAKLWGQRKQNPRMTYEKLSRAMRYYYKSQVLLPVFGRRLVYKFGPNATGLNR